MSFGARALIRLGALEHNLKIIKRAAPGARVMAVIKANAYGHGMIPVARHLHDVDSFAVARLHEALQLRGSGIDKPIVLLAGVLTEHELQQAADHAFEVVVHCDEQIALLECSSAVPTTTWLKFDTGMNRLGFEPARAAELIERLGGIDCVADIRLMTHLASADDLESPMTSEQLERFGSAIEGFDGAVSIANTPATLGWPDIVSAMGDRSGDAWVRPGIALFGISPFADRTGADLGLEPVMRFEARLIAKKPLRAGERVGYMGRYVAGKDTTLGIISAGYGDGYTRHFRDGTPVLLNGRRVPLIGNVSMDMIAVDLGIDADDSVGDVAILWGGDLPVEEVAPWADAIPYELVCGVMHREESELRKA